MTNGLSPNAATSRLHSDNIFELINVTKSFSGKNQVHTALDNVSLSIPKGSFFGIVGTSGAGKSTLLRLLNLLETPTTGEVLFHGNNINKLSVRERRDYLSKVPTIFQHFNLFHGQTVLQNIAFPLQVRGVAKEQRNERARELIRLVNLEGKENSYPSQLSGGQKQRVGIARALICDAEVLLCDEATSALDSDTTHVVLDLLLDLKEKLDLTVVLITHSWGVVRYACETTTLLKEGEIVESGPVRSLLSNPHSYLGKQLLPAPDYGVGPLASDVRFDVLLPNSAQQSEVFSEIARDLTITSSIVSGGVEKLGGQPSARYLVDFHLNEEHANFQESVATIAQRLQSHGIVIGAING